jgi:acetyl-CoA acetyltransferase
MQQAVIVEAARSPIGRRNGKLAGVRPDDLAAHVLGAVVERAGVDPAVVEDGILGCVDQVGEQAFNTSRDTARVNVNGGAIALGHPLGCSGARLLVSLLPELERSGGRFSLATVRIGFGQGIGTIVERL